MTSLDQAPGHSAFDDDRVWVAVCAVDRVTPDRGVAAIVGGEQIAIFRLAADATEGADDGWFAVSHIDPIAAAPVMARGLVGSSGSPPCVIPIIASPLHKQRYDLRTGQCIDDPDVVIATYPIRLHNGVVEICATVISPKP